MSLSATRAERLIDAVRHYNEAGEIRWHKDWHEVMAACEALAAEYEAEREARD